MYKVILKNGTIYRASRVEHMTGFVQLFFLGEERRLPVGEVAEICSTRLEDGKTFFMYLAVLFLVVFIIGLLVL